MKKKALRLLSTVLTAALLVTAVPAIPASAALSEVNSPTGVSSFQSSDHLDTELLRAWVVNDGRHAHVGVAGYAHRFPEGLRRAIERFGAAAPGLTGVDRPARVERRGGPIPVGGLLRRISSTEGLLVGDATPSGSPGATGGPCPSCRRPSWPAAPTTSRCCSSATTSPSCARCATACW